MIRRLLSASSIALATTWGLFAFVVGYSLIDLRVGCFAALCGSIGGLTLGYAIAAAPTGPNGEPPPDSR